MKKLTLLTLLLIGLLFTGCIKELPEVEEAGNIPGMGNTAGELEVTPFEFAEDIKIVGEITGYGNEVAAISGLKSTTNVDYDASDYGSGGQNIRLKITLQNEDTENYTTMYFPQGLICKVDNGEYQNGILLQWTWISLKPGEKRTISLDFMCINLGLGGSDASVGYELIGVAKSEVIWNELLTPIGLKKINIEHYLCKETGELSADYNAIASILQESVWALTNGTELSGEQKEFISSLEEIEYGMYPPEITWGGQLPKFYPEYNPCPDAVIGDIMNQNYANDENGQNLPRVDYWVETAYISTNNHEGNDFTLHLHFYTGDYLGISFKRNENDENFHSYATNNPIVSAKFILDGDEKDLLGSDNTNYQIQIQQIGNNKFRAVINLNSTSWGSFNCVYGYGVTNIPLFPYSEK